MKTTSTVLGAALAAALVVSCGGQNAQSSANTAQNPAPPGVPERMGVTSAQNGFDQKTVDLMADALCDHAEQCNEIGPGRNYATRAACDAQSGVRASNELNATSCPRGVDQSAVRQCIAAIGNEPCSTWLESLSRTPACRTDALCVK